MPPATPAQLAQMRVDLSEVEAQFLRAVRKVAGSTLLNAENLLLLASYSLFNAVGVTTDSTRNVVKGLEDERQTLVEWRVRWRKWAEAGQREDSSKYTFEQWQAVGKSISNSLQYWTGEAAGRTAFAVVQQAATDTTRAVEKVVTKAAEYLPDLPTPEEWKDIGRTARLVGVGVLLTGLLLAGGYAVRAIR